jgi:DNA-binding cell septation regulator SpoVG
MLAQRAVSGTPSEIRSGLLAWLTIEFGGSLILDGLTLRRTVDGRHAISFPLRRDPKGNRHVLIQPVDSDARRRIESAILQQLDLEPIGGGNSR